MGSFRTAVFIHTHARCNQCCSPRPLRVGKVQQTMEDCCGRLQQEPAACRASKLNQTCHGRQPSAAPGRPARPTAASATHLHRVRPQWRQVKCVHVGAAAGVVAAAHNEPSVPKDGPSVACAGFGWYETSRAALLHTCTASLQGLHYTKLSSGVAQ